MSRRNGTPRHPTAKLKGGWSPEEDALLTRLVKKFGEGNWSPIARALNEATGKTESTGRIGKQCRERWNHHLSPGLRKDPWTAEEEVMVVDSHKRLGNKWSDIARCIPGRSENAVKNHWNATLRKRVSPENPAGPLKEYLDTLNLSVAPRKRGGGGGGGGVKRKRPAREQDTSSSDEEGEGDLDSVTSSRSPTRSRTTQTWNTATAAAVAAATAAAAATVTCGGTDAAMPGRGSSGGVSRMSYGADGDAAATAAAAAALAFPGGGAVAPRPRPRRRAAQEGNQRMRSMVEAEECSFGDGGDDDGDSDDDGGGETASEVADTGAGGGAAKGGIRAVGAAVAAAAATRGRLSMGGISGSGVPSPVKSPTKAPPASAGVTAPMDAAATMVAVASRPVGASPFSRCAMRPPIPAAGLPGVGFTSAEPSLAGSTALPTELAFHAGGGGGSGGEGEGLPHGGFAPAAELPPLRPTESGATAVAAGTQADCHGLAAAAAGPVTAAEAAPSWPFPYNWSSNNMQMLAAHEEQRQQHPRMAPRPFAAASGGKVRPPAGNSFTRRVRSEVKAAGGYAAATAAAANADATNPAFCGRGGGGGTPASTAAVAAAEPSWTLRSSAEEDETCLFLSPATDFSASLGMRHVASGSALLSYEAAPTAPMAPMAVPAAAAAAAANTDAHMVAHAALRCSDGGGGGGGVVLRQPTAGPLGRYGNPMAPVRAWTPPNLFDAPLLDFGCPDSPLLDGVAGDSSVSSVGSPLSHEGFDNVDVDDGFYNGSSGGGGGGGGGAKPQDGGVGGLAAAGSGGEETGPERAAGAGSPPPAGEGSMLLKRDSSFGSCSMVNMQALVQPHTPFAQTMQPSMPWATGCTTGAAGAAAASTGPPLLPTAPASPAGWPVPLSAAPPPPPYLTGYPASTAPYFWPPPPPLASQPQQHLLYGSHAVLHAQGAPLPPPPYALMPHHAFPAPQPQAQPSPQQQQPTAAADAQQQAAAQAIAAASSESPFGTSYVVDASGAVTPYYYPWNPYQGYGALYGNVSYQYPPTQLSSLQPPQPPQPPHMQQQPPLALLQAAPAAAAAPPPSDPQIQPLSQATAAAPAQQQEQLQLLAAASPAAMAPGPPPPPQHASAAMCGTACAQLA